MSGRKLRAPAQPPTRHSTTTRRPRNMAALPLPARLLCLFVVGVLTDPSPGRIPKVYNALITSNQNLEPSKAYPVYQPVLHDAFAFPFHPAVFYGDYPLSNGVQPVPAASPKNPNAAPPPPAAPAPAPQDPIEDKPSTTEKSTASPEPGAQPPDTATPSSPLPPNTQSPIPLNQFGLPPQVLPLGRIDPAYSGFTQVGPFTYTYPNFRFYDPYDPFNFSPYSLPPVYRPLANFLGQGAPVGPGNEASSPVSSEPSASLPQQSPPLEPSDLNVLNYSSKDPAIPNVPPPPLPDGGLKSDKSE